MQPSRVVLAALLSLAASSFLAGPASAADKKSDDQKAKAEEHTESKADSTAGDSKSGDASAAGAATEEGGTAHARATSPDRTPAKDPDSPAEDPTKTYFFVGGRYRHTILPAAMLNLFVAGGPSAVSIPSFGIEGSMRKDGTESILSITYADWGMDPFSFKGKDEGPDAWERVSSSLKLINFNVDMLWGHKFNDQMSLQYGLTAGISMVFGDLRRVQGYSTRSNDNNPDNIRPCEGVGDPSGFYCGNNNDHYPKRNSDANNTENWFTEKDWFSGGSRPNLYATFGPQVSFRYKPIKQVVGRLDVGFNLFAGFFFGLGVNYGL